MSFRPPRLAIGDYLQCGGGAVLLVALFALPWYQAPPQIRGALLLMGHGLRESGWQTFMWVNLLCLLVGLLALAASWFALTRASPALAIVTTIVLAPLALLTTVALVLRVWIDLPGVQLPAGVSGGLQSCAGAYIGVAATVATTLGCWLSLRRDGVDPADSPGAIETLPLTQLRPT